MNRNGVWYGRHVFYVNGKRKEKKISFETADEAVAKRRLSRWNNELAAGKWSEPKNIPFGEASRRFMLDRRGVIKDTTLTRYAVSLRQLLPMLRDTPIGDITRSNVMTFVSKRRKDKGRGKRERVADASIRADLACFGAIMAYGIESEWIDVNPVAIYLKGMGRRDVKRGEARTRYLSHDEEARLLLAARNGPQDSERAKNVLADAIEFAIETGMRHSEQFGMRFRDVQEEGRPFVALSDTKSNKPRRVYLSPRAHDVVSRQSRHMTGEHVFWLVKGKKISDLKRGFKAACARAKLHDVQWHDLRRTCGCRMLQDKGATLHEVSRHLGHASVAVTERHYAFLKDEHLADVVSRPMTRTIEGTATILPLVKRIA
jgi:integrase